MMQGNVQTKTRITAFLNVGFLSLSAEQSKHS